MVRDSFTRWAIDQIAGCIHQGFNLSYATLEETIAEHREINEGDGYTLEKSIPGSSWWTRHEGVTIDCDDFAIAAAIALLWWTDEKHLYTAGIKEGEAIFQTNPTDYALEPERLVAVIAPQYADKELVDA